MLSLAVFWRTLSWSILPTWIVFLLSFPEQVLAATIVATTRIPVTGFPDIVVSTFPIPRPSKTGNATDGGAQISAVVSISDRSCDTTCSGTPGTGPNQFDCTTIANKLRAAGSQEITLSPFLGTEFAFRSCKVFVTNQNQVDSVISAQKSVATIAQKLAQDCNAANGAAGGLCVYDGVNAAISVQHT